jgi:hypothetical protein
VDDEDCGKQIKVLPLGWDDSTSRAGVHVPKKLYGSSDGDGRREKRKGINNLSRSLGSVSSIITILLPFTKIAISMEHVGFCSSSSRNIFREDLCGLALLFCRLSIRISKLSQKPSDS